MKQREKYKEESEHESGFWKNFQNPLSCAGTFQDGRKWVLLVGGLIGVVIGMMTFLWSAITALVLLYLVASWAMVTGLFDLAAAFSGWLPATFRWTLALAGVLSILFGIFLALRSGTGLLSLIWLIGIYALVCGVLLFIHAFQSRITSWRAAGAT